MIFGERSPLLYDISLSDIIHPLLLHFFRSMPRIFTRSSLPYLALAAGVLALTVSPMFARWAQASGPVFAFHRMASAAVVLLPFFFREQRQAKARITWAWAIFPILGGLANALDLSTWFTAIHFTRVANATLLNNIAPLWVALFAWLVYKEKLRGLFWGGLFTALAGAAIVLGADFLYRPSLSLGNLIGLASSFFYATYYLITQRGRMHLSAMQYTYIMTLSSGLSTFLFSLVTGAQISGFPWQTYLAFIGAGVVTQSIGFLSLAYALGRLPASLVSATMILQPLLSAVVAIPLLGEALAPSQWIGGVAVLGGIYLVNRSLDSEARGVAEEATP